jgi:hypothetical protein
MHITFLRKNALAPAIVDFNKKVVAARAASEAKSVVSPNNKLSRLLEFVASLDDLHLMEFIGEIMRRTRDRAFQKKSDTARGTATSPDAQAEIDFGNLLYGHLIQFFNEAWNEDFRKLINAVRAEQNDKPLNPRDVRGATYLDIDLLMKHCIKVLKRREQTFPSLQSAQTYSVGTWIVFTLQDASPQPDLIARCKSDILDRQGKRTRLNFDYALSLTDVLACMDPSKKDEILMGSIQQSGQLRAELDIMKSEMEQLKRQVAALLQAAPHDQKSSSATPVTAAMVALNAPAAGGATRPSPQPTPGVTAAAAAPAPTATPGT